MLYCGGAAGQIPHAAEQVDEGGAVEGVVCGGRFGAVGIIIVVVVIVVVALEIVVPAGFCEVGAGALELGFQAGAFQEDGGGGLPGRVDLARGGIAAVEGAEAREFADLRYDGDAV